jgi:hypothetical protein
MQARLTLVMVVIAVALLWASLMARAPEPEVLPETLRIEGFETRDPSEDEMAKLRRTIEVLARQAAVRKSDAGLRPDSGARWFDAGDPAAWKKDPILRRAAVGESIPGDGSWDPLAPDAGAR